MKLTTWNISDASGNKATILNLGARLINWQTSVSGDQNIVVGYANTEDYIKDGAYMGAIAGPFANRVAGARFTHDGEAFDLGANEGKNHLHGAGDGLEKVLWTLISHTEDSVTLGHQHRPEPDHVGYPGDIDFFVTYKIEENNGLCIQLEAKSQKAVPIGPTGHAYLNLGDHSKNINQHKLQLRASHYTPVDSKNIPTGEIVQVHDKFDYRDPRYVTTSLDNNFVLNGRNSDQPCALLSNEGSGFCLEIYSDYPGVQVYTADHMSTPFVSRNAICIEPQFFPDSPNKPHFPFTFTTPEKPFSKTIRYKMRYL